MFISMIIQRIQDIVACKNATSPEYRPVFFIVLAQCNISGRICESGLTYYLAYKNF